MMAENMGVAGHIDDAKLAAGARNLDHLIVGFEHHPRRMAVLHRWHIIDVVRQRNDDNPAVAMADDSRKIEAEHVAIPAIAGFGEEFCRGRLRGAARGEPAAYRFSTRFAEKLGAARDVSPLLVVREETRDH